MKATISLTLMKEGMPLNDLHLLFSSGGMSWSAILFFYNTSIDVQHFGLQN